MTKQAFFNSVSRRQFVTGSCKIFAGTTLFGTRLSGQSLAPDADPHFFLQLFFPGGMDTSYTFDARPLAMTAAQLIQNYLGKEPIEFSAANGGRALRTELVNPLLPFMNRFSVINGVMMAPDFQGHEDNQSLIFTGNPLGGENFLNSFSTLPGASPVSALQLGASMVGDFRVDTQGGLRLTAKGAKDLKDRLGSMPRLEANQRLLQFLQGRLAPRGDEKGSYAKTKLLMRRNLDVTPQIAAALDSLDAGGEEGDKETFLSTAKLVLRIFRSGLAKNAVCAFDTDLSENQNLDAHASEDAKKQPQIIGDLMKELAEVLTLLETTPYDDQRSFLDLTTVLVASEFGRTMRYSYGDFANTGTDHNPYTNTFLIGGKGIKGGQIIGASDFVSVEEKDLLSGAHKELDRSGTSIMGRPFDFSTFRPRDDKPAAFALTDYLTCGSVINTVLSVFGVDRQYWRMPGRQGEVFPVIAPIIG